MTVLSKPTAQDESRSRRELLANRLRQAAKGENLPLSCGQQRLWFLDRLKPGSALYNVPTLARLTGRLNSAALQLALDQLIARHEILRTRFICADGQPAQVVDESLHLPVRIEDLQEIPESDRKNRARAIVSEEANRPFDLEAGPLIRAVLLRLKPDEHWFVLNFHHIVCDEWSLRLCFEELGEFYAAACDHREPVCPELPIQYSDYARWQRDPDRDALFQEQLNYWRQQLQGNPPVLELPADRPRPLESSHRGETEKRVLRAGLADGLKSVAADHESTLFMVLLAAFQTLLQRYTRQDDVMVGSPIAGRDRIESERLIGFFVNTVMLRTDLSGNPEFIEVLLRVRETTLAAYAYADLPFEKIVEDLRPERSLSQIPFTRIFFNHQGPSPEELHWPELTVRFCDIALDTSKFDLTLTVQETAAGLTAKSEYNRDLFSRETIARLLEHFETLLTGIVSNPCQRLSDLPMLSPHERQQLIVDWNRTATEYPRTRTVSELFEEQAARTPEAIAVAFGERSLTYQELNERANRLARWLRKASVGPDVLVGICLERSTDMIVAMLGVLKAGGAYVPLDLSYPKDRLAFMLSDSQAAVLLTTQSLKGRLPQSAARVFCMDSDRNQLAAEESANLSPIANSENLACVIYTSGSTGEPKGVAVPHRAVNRLVRNTNYIHFKPEDRVAQVSNVSFDAATFEIWGALLNGARLVGITNDIALSPREFARELRERRISVIFLTCSLFNQVAAEAPGAFATVDTVVFGGEAADPNAVRAVLADRPPRRLVNGYGPTENTTFSVCHEVQSLSNDATNVPIGRPISNTQCFVLDPHQNPVPVGVPGELHLGGDGLARGYWNRPELTQERFIPNPFGVPISQSSRTESEFRQEQTEETESQISRSVSHSSQVNNRRLPNQNAVTPSLSHPLGEGDRRAGEGSRDGFVTVVSNKSQLLYRTGDLVRWRADGTLEFLGRLDNQVKLRGYRIEPGEIEAVLRQHDAIRDCVVEARRRETGEKHLVAYFVPRNGHTARSGALCGFLRRKLPEYMVPAAFMPLQNLPLMPNGKVNRGALPVPETDRAALEQKYVGPRDSVETRLARIWERVLDVRPVGIEDRFFELGGHSLLAVKLISEIEKEFDRHLQLATIFQAQTIEQLAAILRNETHEAGVVAESSVVEIQSGHPWPPLFLVHGAGGGMFWGYANLSRALGHQRPVYGLKSRGLDGRDEFDTIEDMAAQYVADLRAVQPHGPYHLGGYCFGGNVAFEMARQLEADGEEIALLALLNCSPPNGRYACVTVTPAWMWDFAKNLCYWADYCRQWTPAQRRNFLRWKKELWTKRLGRLIGRASENSGKMDAGNLVDLSSYSPEERRLWEKHIRALTQYRPGRFGGRVHLFRSPGHPLLCSFDDDYGWGELAGGGVSIEVVPGVHEKILEEPCVWAVAEKLRPLVSGIPHESIEDSLVQKEAIQNRATTNIVEIGDKPAANNEALYLNGRREPDPDRNSGNALARQLAEWNDTATDFPLDQTYARHFEAQAARTPDAVALQFEGERWTYAELNARANRLAHHLQALGVGPEVLVAVCLERSLELPAALLAVLKSGGAYLPLDRSYPRERLKFMLSDSRPSVLLTRTEFLSDFGLAATPESGSGDAFTPADVLCLNDPDLAERIEHRPASNPDCAATPDNLAYVIYTSGSTGTPKGVEITRRSLVNHNFAVARAYELGTSDRVLQFSPFSFDISVEEIFPPWLCGAAVVMRTDDDLSSAARFLQTVKNEALTVLNIPTAYWHELVECVRTDELPPSLRLVIIGGEKASDEAWRRWKDRVGSSVALINAYGPTETTVTATLHRARPDDETLPIGKPLANVQAVILDDDLKPVPAGATGELYIGGFGVARGYLNRPELTAQRFIANPRKEISSQRLYKTGDLARFRPDGTIEFAGRADEQVKIRGYRIELGEIETVLASHPELKEAIVVAREDRPGQKRLVAYFVARQSAAPRVSDLLKFLKDRLPGYMAPAAFVEMESLPLTPAGKVDRAALPEPGHERPELDQQFVAPRSPVEEVIAGIWAEVLGYTRVGIQDNFFDLGGHSLLATQVISRMREKLQVEIPLARLFEFPTVASLAERLADAGAQAQPVLPASMVNKGERLPLTPAQHRLWFLDQFEPQQSSYNIPTVLQLRGPLDISAMERSLTELTRRHDALRAIFPAEDGWPVQLICEPQAIKLPLTDLSDVPETERRARAGEIALQESRKTYVMFSPMLRPMLLRLGEAEHWLVLITNEIACDSRSVRVLVDELAAIYEGEVQGRAVSLPPPALRYAEAMAGCKLPPETQTELRRYWKKRLEGAPALLELPTDFPRPPHQSDEGAREPVSLSREATEALEKLGQQEGCTPFMTLMAVFQTLLSRYSGSTDILVGSTTENRLRDEMRGIIGNFDNLLVFRSDASGDPSFREFLRRVRDVVASGLAAKALPFEVVLEEVQPERNASYTPVCQVLFEFDDQPAEGRETGGIQMLPVELDNRTAKLDLKLHLTRTAEGFSGWIEYSTAIFARDRIARMIAHFGELIRAAAADADKKLGDLPLMPGAEADRVLVEWNATARDYVRTATLSALFENQTLRTPDGMALVAGTERLTYAELNDRANQLAHHLRGLGVGPGVMVGICLERSWRLLVGILGVLKAGGAYVPLDPAYPRERLAFILEDAKAPVLVTQESLRDLNPATGAKVVCLDSDWQRIRGASRENPESGVQANDLAYVIYTSGSTGRPKGVALEHRNASALVHWAKNVFTPDELAGVLASTSVCFDLSVFEMFVPLSWGGTVILAENALALPGLPAAREVTLINTVPSAIRELLRSKGIPASVRVVNLAGEPLPTELVNRIYQETAVQKVYDLYGPTETATYSTFALRRPDEPATIGRPLDNEQIFLLDARQQPVPIGIPGEIYIGGAGVARGYLNRPELTAEKFVPNPFLGTPISNSARTAPELDREETERTEGKSKGISVSSVDSCSSSERLYRTGDLARWRADGTLEFLGRMDHQVKIRGFRIELGEVESAFRKHPGLRDFIVIAGEDPGGNKRLVGYAVCHSGQTVSVEELRRFGKEHLPEYMVPSVFVFLDALPLTPNGKVNRKALPAPEPEQRNDGKDFVAPRTPMEEQMSAVWREVLHLERVGVRDNFFELGGHSLLAIQVISRVREVFKVELPLFSLFDAPTIEKLTKGMASREWTQNQLPVLPLRPAPRGGDLPVSFVQERLWFLDQLAPGGHAYNVPAALRLKGPLDVGALQKALDEIERRHEALRTVFRFENGKLTQQIRPPSSCEMARAEFFGTEPSREQELQSWINREAQRPFDLAAGPLMRVSLARCSETDHALLVVMHHTISDGWSLTILFQELEGLYAAFTQGKPAPTLPDLPIQYSDYALWKRQWMDGAVLREELRFWNERLKGAPASVTFPVDHAESEISEDRADRQWLRFSPEATEAITALSQRENCTPFVVLMAALALAFEKWTHQQDLVVGTVVAGRNRRELENVIGCFMNFLPIRARMEGIETGTELLAAIKASVLEAQAHQDCPFEKIVEAVNPERRLNQNPLYNVALLLQNFPAEMFRNPALNVSQLAVETHAALLDLRFEAEFTPQGLALSCEYKSSLFEPATIRQLLASYENFVNALVRKPETPLSDLDITPELKQQAETSREQASENPIAIAGSFTAEPVEDSLAYWLKELDMPAPVKFAPYNQIFQELLDPASLLNTNSRGANVILLRVQDWLRSNEDHASNGEESERFNTETLERTTREFVEAAKSAAARMTVPLLVAICPASPGFAGDDDRGSTIRKIETFVATELDKSSGIHVLTPDDLLRLYPVANYYDASGDELGHVPYTPVFFTALGTAIARKLQATRRPPHKVIVLDCDQTLWSGVCGEDGPKGICLDEPRRALQEFMRAQLDSGRLLTVCSKNSEDDVREVFAQRLDMPLRREHFAAWRTNWQPKSENIKSIARELNLGLDSFVFVDDNPLECAEVEANCPEVLTLQLPENPADIPAFLNHCWVFDHAKLTEEDRKRGALYQQNREREQLRSQSMSLADFLAGLELKIEIAPMTESQIQRVSQLTQRTNQFNFTTVRRTEADMKKLAGQSDVLAVTVRDRFGDYGLVGVVISNTSDTAIEVDTFLLSCRVLGRGVEHEMLARLGAMALERKRRWVNVHFYPSDRNKPAFDFLQSVGADFRQAPNGGYVYQFPAEYAAEVAFTPSETAEPEPLTEKKSSGTFAKAETSSSGSKVRKFARCRAIALTANDALRIHELIEAGKKTRSGNLTGFVAPRNDRERQLCGIWENLLHVERVGATDNFFDLGGHSLLAVRLFAELEKWTGRKLPLVTIFQSPTVEQLATAIEQQDAGSRSPLVPVQPNGSRPPLFLVHGVGGDVLWGYANLAKHTDPDQPIYGIKSRGQVGLEEYDRIEDMARYYLEQIRTFQPQGPYYLGGYCLGGNIAYEMARQLREQGETAALVALIDAFPANAGYERMPWWRPTFHFRFAVNFFYWLKDFIHLPSDEYRRFVSRKARAFGRKILTKLGRRKHDVDLEEVIDLNYFPEHELKFWTIHLRALDRHIQQPYDGAVTLIRTRGQPLFCSLEKDFCWSRLARGGVSVRQIPGSHENIFVEPNVKSLAEQLEECLAEARASAPGLAPQTDSNAMAGKI